MVIKRFRILQSDDSPDGRSPSMHKSADNDENTQLGMFDLLVSAKQETSISIVPAGWDPELCQLEGTKTPRDLHDNC